MEKCYEYLGCKQKDCIMYKLQGDKNCWETEGTLCNHQGMELIKNSRLAKNKNKCDYCIYYKVVKKGGFLV